MPAVLIGADKLLIDKLTREDQEYTIRLRREFHRYPELSFNEFKTSEIIKRELDNLEIPYNIIGNTGVVATIKGKLEGKTIALRADMDALPIKEETDVDYKSSNEGCMHACGHDSHMAMLLGAARVINRMRDDIKGNIRLVFQPAEEVGGGARRLVEEGVLREVDGIFGIHAWSDIETGFVSIEEGPRMAASGKFVIKVKGKGGHGSAPNQGIDAILICSAIVMNLQSVISRELDPSQCAVLGVGSIKSGTAFNIISSEGIMEGTTRCFDHEINKEFPEIIERIARNTAEAYRGEAEVEYSDNTPVLINHRECSKIASKAAEKIGAKNITIDRIKASEDFAEYTNRIPGVFALLGVRNEKKGTCYAQHHHKYNLDEDALEVGVKLFVQYAFDFLNEYNEK